MSTAADTGKIRELLGRGESYALKGDARAAMSFYQAALGAARAVQYVDAETVKDLRRAQAFVQQRAAEFEQALDRAVEGADLASLAGRPAATGPCDGHAEGQKKHFPATAVGLLLSLSGAAAVLGTRRVRLGRRA
ncbi:MAG: hypothetical protein ACR2KH_04530 [Sphingomicrobium sp.]